MRSIKSSFRLPSSWLTASLGKRPRLAPSTARSPLRAQCPALGVLEAAPPAPGPAGRNLCLSRLTRRSQTNYVLFFIIFIPRRAFLCGQGKSLTEAKMGTVKFSLTKKIKKILTGVAYIHLFIHVILYLCWR